MKNTDAAAEEARVLLEWSAAWSDAVGKVTAFVQRVPNMLDTKPAESENGFATRRTVAFAIHALAAAKVHDLTHPETAALITGFVGSTWWRQYSDFLSKLNLPDPAAVLDGGTQWRHDSTRLDVTYVVLSSCTSLVTGDNDSARQKKRGEMLWSLLSDTLDDSADIALNNAGALAGAGIALANKHAAKVCARLQDFKEKLAKLR